MAYDAMNVCAALSARCIQEDVLWDIGLSPEELAAMLNRGWISFDTIDEAIAEWMGGVKRPPRNDVSECAWPRRRARARKRHAYTAFSEAASLYGGTRLA